jgi:methylmalonyl-CoA/ethylmalonyl-CoA epimerase
MYLDHVALATRDASSGLTTLVTDLGGTIISGGVWPSFRSVQVALGDRTQAMKVELIEPWEAQHDHFLERFLTRHDPGPHHLTFKVESLVALLDRVRDAGFTPVDVNLAHPTWKDAFLSPRETRGPVVQVAEPIPPTGGPERECAQARADGPHMDPRWWPELPPRAEPPTYLRRVVMAVPSLPPALDLYAGLLEGRPSPTGNGSVELNWDHGGCIVLEERHDQSPGVDRLELEGPGSSRELTIAGTRIVVN